MITSDRDGCRKGYLRENTHRLSRVQKHAVLLVSRGIPKIVLPLESQIGSLVDNSFEVCCAAAASALLSTENARRRSLCLRRAEGKAQRRFARTSHASMLTKNRDIIDKAVEILKEKQKLTGTEFLKIINQ